MALERVVTLHGYRFALRGGVTTAPEKLVPVRPNVRFVIAAGGTVSGEPAVVFETTFYSPAQFGTSSRHSSSGPSNHSRQPW